MIFSSHAVEAAEIKFNGLLLKAGEEKRNEILSRLSEAEKNVSPDVMFAIRWMYANSPLSDMANYDFSIFQSCAEHGVFLRENSPFASEIPEDIFLNYVLHIRVNEEELCDCRQFFYGLLKDRVNGLSMHDAVIETNYWNAENVMYQATDGRTISALGAFYSAYGRCGEESAFGVNVYRAVGIPARQIYTPRWAHCDDNHAWVEVWCDGAWHFLGACEPEEVLNKGWFTNAASRAMLIHSRCFGEPAKEEEIISKVGMALFLNNLKLYAVTKQLTVHVTDENHNPVEGAEVGFGILNYSNIFDAAIMTTDKDGRCKITCGLGSLNVHVKKDGVFCEKMVYTPDVDTVEMVLKDEPVSFDIWENFVSTAPKDQIVNGAKPTEEQKELCLKKTGAANAKREARVAGMIVTGPVGALTVKNASELSKKILFVAICRTLGIASRINPINKMAEFYKDGRFVPVEVLDQGDSTIVFEKEDGENWLYYSDFTVGRLVNGSYETLDLMDETWDKNRLSITVFGGDYRIITDNRLPNGNLFAGKYHFRLESGGTKVVRLQKYQANLADMLDNFALDEFKVQDENGIRSWEASSRRTRRFLCGLSRARNRPSIS